MSAKAKPSAASALALETAMAPRPATANMAAGIVGEAGSAEALTRLTQAMAELKAMAVQPMLERAVAALNAEDGEGGTEWAMKALDKDETNGFGWYLLGMARERVGDFATSVTAYETAMRLIPDHGEIANELGRLAYRLNMKPQAEKLFRHYLARYPGHHVASNNLACVVRDGRRYDEAVEILRPAIVKNPENSMLWNTMGTVVSEQGDFENAEIFFQEAVRLQPDFARATYNLGNARLQRGDPQTAIELCERALSLVKVEEDRQMMRLARSTILLDLGRIGEGWDDYEARLHPAFGDSTLFVMDAPKWEPGLDLKGKSLLVFGEQGLGDEVLFANLLPDVLEALGPDGHLTLAVERRLVGLFERSFPQVTVTSHITHEHAGKAFRRLRSMTDLSGIDCWVPMGSLLRQFRRDLAAFPAHSGYVAPDPARVDHWRRVLETAPSGPKVGILWKSGISASSRHRLFSPFDAWRPVLATPGVTFVNLQYGDCSEEIAHAEREFGVRIWSPPEIDLKQDLDDVTALCAALDLVVGFSNATFNLAGAAGAPVWLISTPGSWPRLGTQRYPWYPQARVFVTPAFGSWDGVMDALAEALAEFAREPR